MLVSGNTHRQLSHQVHYLPFLHLLSSPTGDKRGGEAEVPEAGRGGQGALQARGHGGLWEGGLQGGISPGTQEEGARAAQEEHVSRGTGYGGEGGCVCSAVSVMCVRSGGC